MRVRAQTILVQTAPTSDDGICIVARVIPRRISDASVGGRVRREHILLYEPGITATGLLTSSPASDATDRCPHSVLGLSAFEMIVPRAWTPSSDVRGDLTCSLERRRESASRMSLASDPCQPVTDGCLLVSIQPHRRMPQRIATSTAPRGTSRTTASLVVRDRSRCGDCPTRHRPWIQAPKAPASQSLAAMSLPPAAGTPDTWHAS